MNDSYAYKGVKKLFLSQVLNIIVSLIFFAVSIILAFNDDYDEASPVFAVLLSLWIAGIAVSAAAFVLQLIGLNQARRDEPVFRTALIFVIVGIVAFTVFLFTYGTFGNIFSGIYTAATLLVSVYTILGVYNLAQRRDDRVVQSRCKAAIILVAVLFAFAFLTRAAGAFSPLIGEDAADILDIVCSLLEFAGYFVFLRYLDRAKKMLATQEPPRSRAM